MACRKFAVVTRKNKALCYDDAKGSGRLPSYVDSMKEIQISPVILYLISGTQFYSRSGIVSYETKGQDLNLKHDACQYIISNVKINNCNK